MKRIFYISIDNLHHDFTGCFGGEMETKFIDILSADGFILKKHFCSSDSAEENFFSMMTGVTKPDLNEDCDLATLLVDNFAGVCVVPQKDTRKVRKAYIEPDLIDIEAFPSDIAASAIKYIRDEECGFLYIRHAVMDKTAGDRGYPEQVFKMDASIGKLLAAIEEYADYDESYVVITGSAGKTTVPCIFKAPNSMYRRFYSSNRNVHYLTRDIDILPTIFELEGQLDRLPHSIDGTSIVQNLTGVNQKLSAIKANSMVYDSNGMQVA